MVRRPLGYVENPPDGRDLVFGVEPGLLAATDVPDSYQLLPHDVVPLNEQTAESCCGFAITGILQDIWMAEGVVVELASALFVWWCSRKQHGAEASNVGTFIRTAFEVCRKVGYCRESRWPSLGGQDTVMFAQQPPAGAFRDAYDQRLTKLNYSLVLESGAARGPALKRGLSSGAVGPKRGLVLGIQVDAAAMAYDGRGVIDPPVNPKTIIGGHCLRATGYDAEGLWCPGSWGKDYGRGGWHVLSWDYVASQYLTDPTMVSAPPEFPEGVR